MVTRRVSEDFQLQKLITLLQIDTLVLINRQTLVLIAISIRPFLKRRLK